MLYIITMEQKMTDEQIRRKIAAERRRKKQQQRLRIVCVIAAAAVILGCVAGVAIGGGFGKLSVGTDSAELTPVTADQPLVNTAAAELGNKGGEKFWSWYGFDSHVAWCACFVSWVEDQCDLFSSESAPKFSYVSDGSAWFKDRGQWLGSDEIPEPGDLIFFDWEQDGGQDHVGIVSAVVDDKVFTIEGNSSDRCRIKRYYIGDPVIYGYGHINAEFQEPEQEQEQEEQ